jgi:hypothetical protein
LWRSTTTFCSRSDNCGLLSSLKHAHNLSLPQLRLSLRLGGPRAADQIVGVGLRRCRHGRQRQNRCGWVGGDDSQACVRHWRRHLRCEGQRQARTHACGHPGDRAAVVFLAIVAVSIVSALALVAERLLVFNFTIDQHHPHPRRRRQQHRPRHLAISTSMAALRRGSCWRADSSRAPRE